MKKIFSFLCLIVAVTAMTSCSSAKEEKGTSGTGNAVLDNIFERKSVRAYLNKGVEKEKIFFIVTIFKTGSTYFSVLLPTKQFHASSAHSFHGVLHILFPIHSPARLLPAG